MTHAATHAQHVAALLLDDPIAREVLQALRARNLRPIAGGVQFSIPRGRSVRGVTLMYVVSDARGVQLIAARPTRGDVKEIDRAQGVLAGSLGESLSRLTGLSLHH